ncbi:tRNA pseudouridine(55) synthase TruB [Anabaena sp. FACHB-1237]|uniref:tRNA pseudouridine(55) synthase TruB n=1 Tax=Anabaena sp. FACHB-1237 TaxID=2692769 RepID=UPI001681B55E|nr:tRNA pseudouridine(55) synthase TruB [Anabaena sp. FACHB-1237]MBD2137865.1 tRNA pseudouridine(55) synthase TruB [Anabaena sp. FACHB-1237]
MDGFINLHKPYSWTSHDCVARVRKLLKMKKVGHAGTLDPAATGVLPIACGKTTRLLQYLANDKAYIATVRFGISTATDDLEGEIIASQSHPDISLDKITPILPQFIGKISQIPPSYSAIQIDGKRLYDLARKGEMIQAHKRTVEVFEINVLAWREGDFPELDIMIACGTGTYIRAIARDLGIMLNIPATLAGLQRTVSSGFPIDGSVTLSDLETQVNTNEFTFIPPDAPLKHLEKINLPSLNATKWCQGQKVFVDVNVDGNITDFLRVYDEENLFLGIGNIGDNVLIPQMVFRNL